jgi:hypothetical protein
LCTVVVAPAPPLVVVVVYVAAAVREVIAAPDVVELDALNCLAAAPTGVGFPSFFELVSIDLRKNRDAVVYLPIPRRR